MRAISVRVRIHDYYAHAERFGGKSGIMSAFEGLEDFVREKVEKERWTHKKTSDFLQKNSTETRGLSERSVRRYCASKDIHKTPRIDDQMLDDRVASATAMVSTKSTQDKCITSVIICKMRCSFYILPGWASLRSENYDGPAGIAGD